MVKQVIAFYLLIAVSCAAEVLQSGPGIGLVVRKQYAATRRVGRREYDQDNQVLQPTFYKLFTKASRDKKSYIWNKYRGGSGNPDGITTVITVPSDDDNYGLFWKKMTKASRKPQKYPYPGIVMQYPAIYPKSGFRPTPRKLPNPEDVNAIEDDDDYGFNPDEQFVASAPRDAPYYPPQESTTGSESQIPAVCLHHQNKHAVMENIYRRPASRYDFEYPFGHDADSEREIEEMDPPAPRALPRMPYNPRSRFPSDGYPPMVFHPVHHPYNPFFFVFPKNDQHPTASPPQNPAFEPAYDPFEP